MTKTKNSFLKKTVSMLLVVKFLFPALPLGVISEVIDETPSNAYSSVPGDVNGNGKTNL